MDTKENDPENTKENDPENTKENVVDKHVGLKSDIKEYLELDDEINKINKELKVLKLEKKEIEMKILEYMKITKTDQINLGKGKLKLVKSKTYEVLKKDYIVSQLSEKLDKSKAEDIADQLIKNRKTNEVSKIQRN
jgi:hypothetical protein